MYKIWQNFIATKQTNIILHWKKNALPNHLKKNMFSNTFSNKLKQMLTKTYN